MDLLLQRWDISWNLPWRTDYFSLLFTHCVVGFCLILCWVMITSLCCQLLASCCSDFFLKPRMNTIFFFRLIVNISRHSFRPFHLNIFLVHVVWNYQELRSSNYVTRQCIILYPFWSHRISNNEYFPHFRCQIASKFVENLHMHF